MSKLVDICCVLFLYVVFGSCKPYKVYWNIPTFGCRSSYDISFTKVARQFNITVNDDDKFYGNQINILYSPGSVPRIENYIYPKLQQNVNLTALRYVNGGVPLGADLIKHLDDFEKDIKSKVPGTNNSGLAVLDLEEWGATWAQNFNHMEIYRIVTRMKIKAENPKLTEKEIEHLAVDKYQKSAMDFLVKTLRYGQKLRPKAKFGYYQYPQCFNAPGYSSCSIETQKDNDKMIEMWRHSHVLFPSLYLSKYGTVNDRAAQIRGRVREAKRVTKFNKKLLVIPYIRTNFYNGQRISIKDLENLIKLPKEEGADGVVLWGSYNEISSEVECHEYREYLIKVLGPMAKKYISL